VKAIREDRILHEVHASSGDIRRICGLFGLSISAAERYVGTIDHPDLIVKSTTASRDTGSDSAPG
jgi:hypothetical protein